MDLSVYSLPRLMKEKRERQPNWSETEKLLLLSLTRKHQTILENKGSDTMTLKRKSEAWDEIAVHMNAAGYNRSKERLKQQLGRIRAAEAKRAKEALEKSLTMDENCANPLIMAQSDRNNNLKSEIYDKGGVRDAASSDVHDEPQIKVEETVSMYDERKVDCNNQPMSSQHVINVAKVVANDNNFRPVQQSVMRLILQNTKEVNETYKGKEVARAHVSPAKADFTSTLPDATNTAILAIPGRRNDAETSVQSQLENGYNSSCELENTPREKVHLRHSRLAGIRTPTTKEKRLRQLHVYRVAVERERLRSLKLQQKRDRMLHRKDVLIQNLKVQILRNITNQNRGENSINF